MLWGIAAVYGIVVVIDMAANHRGFMEALFWPARTGVKILVWIIKMLTMVAATVPGWKESIDRLIPELQKWADKLRELRDRGKK